MDGCLPHSLCVSNRAMGISDEIEVAAIVVDAILNLSKFDNVIHAIVIAKEYTPPPPQKKVFYTFIVSVLLIN